MRDTLLTDIPRIMTHIALVALVTLINLYIYIYIYILASRVGTHIRESINVRVITQKVNSIMRTIEHLIIEDYQGYFT